MDLMDRILMLDKHLVIPSSLLEIEISVPKTLECVNRLIYEKKPRISAMNTLAEINMFKYNYDLNNSLASGELDVMLTCKKYAPGMKNVRRVLDEFAARRRAAEPGIAYIGLLGLLEEMRSGGITSKDEFEAICKKLRESGFRIPAKYKPRRPCQRADYNVQNPPPARQAPWPGPWGCRRAHGPAWGPDEPARRGSPRSAGTARFIAYRPAPGGSGGATAPGQAPAGTGAAEPPPGPRMN